VALHEEHGSFGADESVKLMMKAQVTFQEKWKATLSQHHVVHPSSAAATTRSRRLRRNDKLASWLRILQASDLQARNPAKANILYIDNEVPNKRFGAGYGRAFDNLSMLSELGHRVTVVTTGPWGEPWCNAECLQEFANAGIELAARTDYGELIKSRAGFYDIVLVSRGESMKKAAWKLRHLYRQSPFYLLYDSEGLASTRSQLKHLVEEQGINFPSGPSETLPNQTVAWEEAVLHMPDGIIAISRREKEIISQKISKLKEKQEQEQPGPTKHVKGIDNIDIIGHMMRLEHVTQARFSERNGILFLAGFHNTMYYNGDAIWYFLKETYPLVLKEGSLAKNTIIPITIAGRYIPDELKQYVSSHDEIAPHVLFVDSPSSTYHLYNQARIVIAPHLYGCGIQYKVCVPLF